MLLSSTPSVWPVRGYLSAAFGNRIDPFTAQKDFHPGIDISTPIGTKVQAVWVRDQAQNPIHVILDEYRTFG